MPTRHGAPLGAPTWIDLSSSDTDRAKDFYGTVFGWTFESSGPGYGGYINAFKDGQPVAGLMFNDPQWNSPDGWTTYLHTADITATVAAATAAGGVSCVEPMEVKDKGRMAILTDPAGAFFGLWQPIGHQGFEVVGEAGAPVWHQLTTRDYGRALDGQELLGVMDGAKDLPEGVPSNWFFFLGAEDVDKTVELIVENGGTVVRAAEDTPYGRLAVVADRPAPGSTWRR